MLKHFMKFRPGWWVLHLAAILFTFWLGAATRF
jgi:hypothetical protein